MKSQERLIFKYPIALDLRIQNSDSLILFLEALIGRYPFVVYFQWENDFFFTKVLKVESLLFICFITCFIFSIFHVKLIRFYTIHLNGQVSPLERVTERGTGDRGLNFLLMC